MTSASVEPVALAGQITVPRVGRLGPFLLTATAIVALGAAIALAAGSPGWSIHRDDYVWFASWLLWCPAGVFIARDDRGRRYGLLLAALGASIEVGALMGSLAHRWLLNGGPHTLGLSASILQRAFSDLPVFFLAFGLLIFPDGHTPSRRWRPVALAAAITPTVTLLADLTRTGTVDTDLPIANPLALRRLAGLITALADVSTIVLLGLLVVGLMSVIVRWRSGVGAERAAAAVFAVGACFVVALLISASVAAELGWAPGHVTTTISLALLISLIPVTAAASMVRRIRYGAEAILNRSITYLVIAVIVVAGYAASVTLLGRIFESKSAFGVSLIATGVIAVALGPLKLAVQRGVERALLGQRNNPYAALSTLGGRISETPTPHDALDAATRTVAETLKAPYVALSVRAGDGEAVVSEYGRAARLVLDVPLIHAGETVGTLRLAGRSLNERFNAADQRLLGDFAGRIAGTVAVVQLTEALRQSRADLVRAREEERRRIRRELHDGVGPVLASAALALGRAQRQFDATDRRHDSLREAGDEVRQTIGDIRELVHDLRPPALDELGLAAAVRQRAATLNDPFATTVMCEAPPSLGALPAAVEVAGYRIAAEAMTNAVRHAHASHCTVTLSITEDMLTVTVTDDGDGIRPGTPTGVGISSMRERAAELGGTFSICTAADQTEVTACLPIT
ncbi:MAG: GAF domain-containing sensor histidine kinase [Actinomycetota bacterium]|nr:GAF domain-containing sensor histidine kinase [Actinomycetota bacterium]